MNWISSAGRPELRIALRQTVLALLVAVGLSATGCAKGTYLEVKFTGSQLPDIYGIRVMLTLTPATDAGGRSIGTVDSGTVIKLPTSMAFQLDSETGSLQVDAAALDMNGREVARASATTNIMHAKTWTLVLNLTPL
jgi:hypothetical protein